MSQRKIAMNYISSFNSSCMVTGDLVTGDYKSEVEVFCTIRLSKKDVYAN